VGVATRLISKSNMMPVRSRVTASKVIDGQNALNLSIKDCPSGMEANMAKTSSM
jgi:hypothetical protein